MLIKNVPRNLDDPVERCPEAAQKAPDVLTTLQKPLEKKISIAVHTIFFPLNTMSYRKL